MKRSSDLKADIEKIQKLKALQQKATDKLNKITKDAAVKPPKKKKTAVKKRAKAPAKKASFWKKLFGNDSNKTIRSKS
jgi:hypothetical protein